MSDEKLLREELEVLRARLVMASEFEVGGPGVGGVRVTYVSIEEGKTECGWYVIDRDGGVLGVDGKWNHDFDDDWDDRHRFETADAAFAALVPTDEKPISKWYETESCHHGPKFSGPPDGMRCSKEKHAFFAARTTRTDCPCCHWPLVSEMPAP